MISLNNVSSSRVILKDQPNAGSNNIDLTEDSINPQKSPIRSSVLSPVLVKRQQKLNENKGANSLWNVGPTCWYNIP